MRKREVIEKDGSRPDILAVEVLLDIRDLLVKNYKSVKKRNEKRIKIK